VARFRQGQSQRTIAAQMGLNGKTVRRYLQAGTFPEMQPRYRRRQIDRYSPSEWCRRGGGRPRPGGGAS
jgi:transposase